MVKAVFEIFEYRFCFHALTVLYFEISLNFGANERTVCYLLTLSKSWLRFSRKCSDCFMKITRKSCSEETLLLHGKLCRKLVIGREAGSVLNISTQVRRESQEAAM